MQKPQSYFDFLRFICALDGASDGGSDASSDGYDTGSDAASEPRDRYLRIYVGPSRRDAELQSDLEIRFGWPGTRSEDLDRNLWPALANLLRTNMGWCYLECVESLPGHPVVKRCAPLRCTGEDLEAGAKTDEQGWLKALQTGGINHLMAGHASVVDRLATLAEHAWGSLQGLYESQRDAAAELAHARAQAEAATKWATAQLEAQTEAEKWATLERMSNQLWPETLKVVQSIGVGWAAGGSRLGKRPSGPPAKVVAWNLEAMRVLLLECRSLVVADTGIVSDEAVRAAGHELWTTGKTTLQMAEAFGVDFEALFAEAPKAAAGGAA